MIDDGHDVCPHGRMKAHCATCSISTWVQVTRDMDDGSVIVLQRYVDHDTLAMLEANVGKHTVSVRDDAPAEAREGTVRSVETWADLH